MGGPIHIGADPRWHEYQRQRQDAAMSDILQALQYRQQRDDQREAQTMQMFFENPSLIGGDVWQDFSSRAGSKYSDLIGIGNELAAQRAQETSTSAEAYRFLLDASKKDPEASISAAEPPLRDEPGDLFSFTGIQPGSGPLAPEFWPENAPAQEAPGVRIPENPFARMAGAVDDQTLVRIFPELFKKVGSDMLLPGNPAVLNALQPDVRNLGVLLDENPQLQDQFEQSLRLATGAEMSAAQQAANQLGEDRLAQQIANDEARLGETQRHNRETEGLSRERFEYDKSKPEKGSAFKFDPKDYAEALTGGYETQYDDEGKPLPEGLQTGIDKSTATRIGQLVSSTLAGLPPEQQQAATEKSTEQIRSAFGYFMDAASGYFGGLSGAGAEAQGDPELTGGAPTDPVVSPKAKVRAQQALLQYVRELQKISRIARSREEGDELRLAAFNKAREYAAGGR